jgi:hypothetical protein
MALLSTGALTLADWAKRLDPDGQVPKVAELLSQTNEILEDAVFMEGNLPTGHRLTIRTGLPQVFYRMINQGVPTSKSLTAQIDEACGILEARSHIDVELAKLNGNTAAFRLSEDQRLHRGDEPDDGRRAVLRQPRHGPAPVPRPADALQLAVGAATRRTSSTRAAPARTTARSTWSCGARTPSSARSRRARRPA